MEEKIEEKENKKDENEEEKKRELLYQLHKLEGMGHDVRFSDRMNYRDLLSLYHRINEKIYKEQEYKFKRDILFICIAFLENYKIIDTTTALELFQSPNKKIGDYIISLMENNKEKILKILEIIYEKSTPEERQKMEEFLRYFEPEHKQ